MEYQRVHYPIMLYGKSSKVYAGAPRSWSDEDEVKVVIICTCHVLAEMGFPLNVFVTGSTKTVLIAQDRKFDFFTQTQSLMNILSNFTATVDQSKVVCFCWLLF